MDDLQLLRQYVDQRSESAFAQLVDRHIDLVFSTCMRLLRNRQDAEDATQAAFIVLARKAKSIRSDTILAAWLYRTARWAAASAVRRNQTRKRHESAAARAIDMTPDASITR